MNKKITLSIIALVLGIIAGVYYSFPSVRKSIKDFSVSFSNSRASSADLVARASQIGKMYDCQNEKPNIPLIAGNVGYSFTNDEIIYSYAKLLNEKGCHKGNEKYVIFLGSTGNFPANG